jgi:FHA domain
MRGIIVALALLIAAPCVMASAAAAQTVAETAVAPGEAALWTRVQAAFTEGSGKEPQLMLVAAVLGGLLPVLSLAALASRFGVRRWVARRPETFAQIEMAPAITRPQVREIRGQLPLLDVIGIGADADVHRIDSSMIRIGRHEENDIRLVSQTVHRYHAVLHRTSEQKFVITDLSGPQGNGVVVNAERVDQAALAAGDLIELGDVRLRFRFGEAH